MVSNAVVFLLLKEDVKNGGTANKKYRKFENFCKMRNFEVKKRKKS